MNLRDPKDDLEEDDGKYRVLRSFSTFTGLANTQFRGLKIRLPF